MNKITKGTFAVCEGDYKLIHYLETEKSLLFNLKEDPGELNNIFDIKTDKCQHLYGLLKDNLLEANKKIIANN